MSGAAVSTPTGARGVVLGATATAMLLTLALIRVMHLGPGAGSDGPPAHLPQALTAAAVLALAFGVGASVRHLDLRLWSGFPWLVSALSLVVSAVPWWSLWAGDGALGSGIYSGLKVPQGIVQFWDLTLPLQSIACAAVGVDVYAANNGCLADPTIYAPGVLWLQWVPFDLFSARNVSGLGALMILISSLALLWLARASRGLGQILLLVAAVGGPWLLLLERGNLDAAVIWAAIATVILVRRWDTWWAWSLGAAVLWLMGTWKYYPFAMGLMLLPVLRLRRGWTVLVGYAAAVIVFMALTWETFRFSSQSNSAMVDYSDMWTLGRAPVVARMVGSVVPADGIQAGDLLVGLLVLAAIGWGIWVARAMARSPWRPSMLGVAGSSLYLASVLVAGFGWAYKATFLLLGVPLLSTALVARRSVVVASAAIVTILVGISAVVVWNVVLATLAGVLAAGFLFGLSMTVLLRVALPGRRMVSAARGS